MSDPVEALMVAVDDLEGEIAEAQAYIAEKRMEVAILKARAERIAAGGGVRIRPARPKESDPLMAKAAVSVELMPWNFSAGALAEALAVDAERAERILMALAELGQTTRLPEGGWGLVDPLDNDVRDWVVQEQMFEWEEVKEAFPEIEANALRAILERLGDRGIVTVIGGLYEYVPLPEGNPAREDRRPPEKEPPAFLDAKATGMPVRLVDHGRRAQIASVPGQGLKIRMRDRAYERQQAANAERAEQNRRREARRKQGK